MTSAEYEAAHSRSIKAAYRNGLRPWLPVWFWPALVLIRAIAFGLECRP